MFIPMSQQYEERNNRVINPSYVEIQKNHTLQGCSVLGFLDSNDDKIQSQ